jgi:hypothetical protein
MVTLSALTVLLIAAGIASQLLKYVGGFPNVYGLVPELDLSAESNVPTFFSSLLLTVAALLLWLIATIKRNLNDAYAAHWSALGPIVLLLALDEVASLHERLNRPLSELGDFGGVFLWPWVIPAMIIVALTGLAFWRFFMHLPARFRRFAGTAAGLFVAGSIGVEMVGGHHADGYGTDNLTYELMTVAEETLELAAVLVLLYALLDYLHATMGQLRVTINPLG